MMLCCSASPNAFKEALSWSLAPLSILRTKDGTRAVARIAITARTPTISISENAHWPLRGAQPQFNGVRPSSGAAAGDLGQASMRSRARLRAEVAAAGTSALREIRATRDDFAKAESQRK